MSDALYLEDSYIKTWNAHVIGVKDGKYIILDKTAFYPAGGGQPCDEGFIIRGSERFRVVFCGKFSGEISHEVDHQGLVEGDEVSCELDWARRYKLMRSHTASHLISAVIYANSDAKITGNQLGVDKSRMDFSMDDYHPEKIKEFIDKANIIIERDLPVSVYSVSRQEALNRPELARLAKGLPENIPNIRVVKIGDVDEQADGGTHVKSLSEVGRVELLKTENKGSSNRRLYFALKD